MLIEVTKKEKTQVEIPVPCFFRDKEEETYLGILDDKTVVRIFKMADYTSVINSTPDKCDNYIREAWENYHSCTETEFMEAYDKTLESISLHPKLAV